MAKKKSIEEDINLFLEKWDCERLTSFLRDVTPLLELYDVEDEDDWLEEGLGKEGARNVRLIRTVYLVSRIAEFHAGTLCSLRMNFPKMWERMERNAVVEQEGT